MQRRALVLVTVLGVGSAAAQETPRTPWGHPDFQGTWTNATLTPLQRPAELGAKEFYTPAELAEFAAQRRAATNADRPLRAGDVGSYNDFFFERGSGGVKTGRTSLVIEPRDRAPGAIATGPRIGITRAVDRALRFWIEGNPNVSRAGTRDARSRSRQPSG